MIHDVDIPVPYLNNSSSFQYQQVCRYQFRKRNTSSGETYFGTHMKMAELDEFETRRLQNIKRNRGLLQSLGVDQQAKAIHDSNEPTKKKRKVEKKNLKPLPSRSSARIASVTSRPTYQENNAADGAEDLDPRAKLTTKQTSIPAIELKEEDPQTTDPNRLKASWSSWEPTAPPPTRSETGVFHFSSHPSFMPNKSPEEVIREGCFGGSYFRPLYSKKLDMNIEDDWVELPSSWTERLDVDTYLTSPTYDPEINKFKVACGQSIEEWEAAGWINHEFDVRGWFQWYVRFFVGRRCEDDERQISRWKKCVGETGRWRRILLKKYQSAGVREVFDDGSEDHEEVSPVIHQTCHHWAFMVTQDILDEYWRTGK